MYSVLPCRTALVVASNPLFGCCRLCVTWPSESMPRMNACDRAGVMEVEGHGQPVTALSRCSQLAQLAPKDLTHVGFGQFVTELDVLRYLVSGQTLAAKLAQFFAREIRVLRNDKKLHCFTG